jgi:Ca-activated chloride channel family protein
LPILNLGRCVERDRPLDVVLAIDASSSMSGTTPDGVVKLDAAKAGARRFVGQMLGGEHVAVVSFNTGAELAPGLSADQAALSAAIDAIAMAAGTRLDLAIDTARMEFASERAQPGASKVLVLLTDGRPTNTTPEAVLAAAAAARDAGVLVFTIGLGQDLDPELLVGIAGAQSRCCPASSPEDRPSVGGGPSSGAHERYETYVAERFAA